MRGRWKILIVGAAVTAGLYMQPYRIMRFNGESMAPTYKNGEMLLYTDNVDQVKKGDVVLVKTENGVIVKRVSHVPGDIILLTKVGPVWREAPASTKPLRLPTRWYRMPEGQIQVVGDNLSKSLDSRQFGSIPASSVIGKVLDQRRNKQEWPGLSRFTWADNEVDFNG